MVRGGAGHKRSSTGAAESHKLSTDRCSKASLELAMPRCAGPRLGAPSLPGPLAYPRPLLPGGSPSPNQRKPANLLGSGAVTAWAALLAVRGGSLLFGVPEPELVFSFSRDAQVLVAVGGESHVPFLYEVGSEVLEARSRARAVALNPVLVEGCIARSGGDAPLLACEVEAALAPDRGVRAEVLVWLRGMRSGETVLFGFVDLGALRATVRSDFDAAAAARGRPQAETIFDRLTSDIERARGRLLRLPAADRDQLSVGLRGAFDEGLQALLDRIAPLVDGPEVLLRTRPAGASVSMDGGRPERTSEGGFRYLGLSRGAHVARVEKPGFVERELAFTLADSSLTYEVALSASYRTERLISGAAGLAVLGAGIGLAVFAVEEASGRTGARHADLGLVRWEAPSLDQVVLEGEDALQGSGPLLGGLAAGALTTGVVLGALGLLSPDEPRPPWVDILIAVGAGAVAYGATEVVAAID